MARCSSLSAASCCSRPSPQSRGIVKKHPKNSQKQQRNTPKPVKQEQAGQTHKELGDIRVSHKAYMAFVKGPLSMMLVRSALEHAQKSMEVCEGHLYLTASTDTRTRWA